MRLKRYVGQIADSLDVADRWEVEVAALISQLGCVSLPLGLIVKMHVGGELDASEQAMVDALPATAASFVAELPRLDAIRNILTHHNTPYAAPYSVSFDGPAPNLGTRVGAIVPLGARMLKAASDLDWLLAGGMSETSALSSLAAREGVYDPEVLNALSRALGCMPEVNTWRVRLRDVREGMVFSAGNDLLIMPAHRRHSPFMACRLRPVLR